VGARLGKLIAAGVIYGAFAVYLYCPYFRGPEAVRIEDLFVFNVCAASLGCFVLSRRWLAGFWESLFAGAVYGFSPFVLWLGKFHPSAGLLAATVPWLFCPAAYGPRGRFRWLRWILALLPFLAIVLFFTVSAHFRLFAVPVESRLQLSDLGGLIAPLAMAKRGEMLIGFYHVPVASLVMGFSMLFAARRLGVMIVLASGVVLALSRPFLQVSPVMWLTIPVLCCSVIIGAGMQGLISAGSADKGWVLTSAVTLGVLAIVTLLLATKYFQVFASLADGYARVFLESATMYIVGAVTAAIIFFSVRSNLRLAAVRLVLLALAMAVDIFLGARFIIDRIFKVG